MIIQPSALEFTLNTPAPGYVRTPGLHMSDIYGSLYQELEPKRFKSDGPPHALKMELGSSFEEAWEMVMSRRLLGERPGEFACLRTGEIVPVGTPKSIIFSPDHFFHINRTKLGEFKATWMTILSGIQDPKFDKWFCQMKSYGFPLKMREQVLVVYFVNGHGKWVETEVPGLGAQPPGPLLLPWDVTFTQLELETNWNMLMRHAEKKGMDI